MPAMYLLTSLCNNAFGVSGDSFHQASSLQSYLTQVLITISKTINIILLSCLIITAFRVVDFNLEIQYTGN